MRYLFLLLAVLLSSCAVKAKKVSFYDDDCQLVSKKYELTSTQLHVFDEIGPCSNEDCLVALAGRAAGAAIIFSVSSVVSGSILIVGNTIYWLERQGECKHLTQAIP